MMKLLPVMGTWEDSEGKEDSRLGEYSKALWADHLDEGANHQDRTAHREEA